MASLNKVQLIGNLGKDPEVRYTNGGDSITTVTVATSESWKDKSTGEKKESTEWHKVVFFGKLAEIAGQYLHKGSKIYVEGKIKTRKWTDQTGAEKYTTEVVVDFNGTMIMLDGKPGLPGQDVQAPRPQSKSMPSAPAALDDDIPF